MSPEKKFRLRRHKELYKFRIDTWNEVSQEYDEGTFIFDTLLDAAAKLQNVRYEYLLNDPQQWESVSEQDIYGVMPV